MWSGQLAIAPLVADAPRQWSWIYRSRYQLLLGLVFVVLLPALARSSVPGGDFTRGHQINTALGSMIAMVLGYIGFRRLQIFPGLGSGGHVIASFTATFATLAAAMLLVRLDYSRLQLLGSYGMCIALYTGLQLSLIRNRKLVFGVIPGGEARILPVLDNIRWHDLGSAKAPPARFDGVLADLRVDHPEAWNRRITEFVLQGTPVYHVKDAIEQLTGRVEIERLSENNLGSLNPNDVFLKVKSLVDRIAALVLIILLAPLLAVVALFIRLDSPGPVLFKQARTGFRGKPFVLYKFRTMTAAGERPTDDRTYAMTQDHDPRITRPGHFLRRTRIDELPQLFNVLKGEMSLIGPRPEVIALTRWYESELSFYHYRHIIKPGISGWAQVNQGHVAQVDAVRKKLHLDFYYIKNFSLWLDILITMRTFGTILSGFGAR